MPALIILHLLKPDDTRNGDLLTAVTDALGWTVPLEARFDRIEIGFVGGTMEEGMNRVGSPWTRPEQSSTWTGPTT